MAGRYRRKKTTWLPVRCVPVLRDFFCGSLVSSLSLELVSHCKLKLKRLFTRSFSHKIVANRALSPKTNQECSGIPNFTSREEVLDFFPSSDLPFRSFSPIQVRTERASPDLTFFYFSTRLTGQSRQQRRRLLSFLLWLWLWRRRRRGRRGESEEIQRRAWIPAGAGFDIVYCHPFFVAVAVRFIVIRVIGVITFACVDPKPMIFTPDCSRKARLRLTPTPGSDAPACQTLPRGGSSSSSSRCPVD